MSTKSKRVDEKMKTKIANPIWKHVCGALLGLPLVVTVGAAGAAETLIATHGQVVSGVATLRNYSDTTKFWTSTPFTIPGTYVEQTTDITEVSFDATASNRTVWVKMQPSSATLNPDLNQDFRFILSAASADQSTYFGGFTFAVWKPFGDITDPSRAVSPVFPSSGDYIWGEFTSCFNSGFGCSPLASTDPATNGEMAVIQVNTPASTPTGLIGGATKVALDTSLDLGATDFYRDATWYGFNDLASFDPNDPNAAWYLGLSVDGADANARTAALLAALPEVSAAPVPIPAAFWMFGSALLGVAAIRRQRKAAES